MLHRLPKASEESTVRTASRRLYAALGALGFVWAAWTTGGAANAEDVRSPTAETQQLVAADGLAVTLFASEPLLASPTNLDIDNRGRVWVCEVLNYHRNRGRRKEGDRILILEDTDGDGRADDRTVFYQGTDVDSAMGICVLGERVLVTSSPNILVLTDTNGDDRADRKDVLFTKTGHPEHDHSAHSFVFGPDGRFYWNFGNMGGAVHDAAGNPVMDSAGRRVVDERKPYQGGMVFRCAPDGSAFEVLGHNFRNNYELAVDAFGTVWQTDNDDDGNRGVRLNYVMEYGNFGFRDERTGASWKTERTGQHEDVGQRHWHQNDPGVVPNCLGTGNGAPSGITIYEGRLLPSRFWDRPLHGDTVTNTVHVDVVQQNGAGYSGKTDTLLHSPNDAWFRPVDVATAPDGSVFVTDWYDPGVGGHRQADTLRGRIFRIAPPKSPYVSPSTEVATAEGAVEALKSPNAATRYLAWMALVEKGAAAEPALLGLFRNRNPRFRARALWLLGRLEGQGERYVGRALTDRNASIRVVGLRLARQLRLDVAALVTTVPLFARVTKDASAAVRRECALALHLDPSPRASKLWAKLAVQHDGQDRWYLEALGIGAGDFWKARFDAWLEAVDGRWDTPGGRDIVWRSRSPRALPLLAACVRNVPADSAEWLRYFRAFDFHTDASKNAVLLDLAAKDHPSQDRIAVLALRHYEGSAPGTPEWPSILERALAASRGTEDFVQLVRRFDVPGKSQELLAFALAHPKTPTAGVAVGMLQDRGALGELAAVLEDADPTRVHGALTLLTEVRSEELVAPLAAVVADSSRALDERAAAIRAHRQHPAAERSLLALLREGKIPRELHLRVADVFRHSHDAALQEAAAPFLKMPDLRMPESESGAKKPNSRLPPLRDLLERRGAGANGRALFFGRAKCATCHIVEGEGKAVGPDLSGVGRKLDRSALLESILEPSVAISHGYEAYTVVTKQGVALSGVLRERTDDSVTITTADGLTRIYSIAGLESFQRQATSLMPADLHHEIGVEGLVDLVEFLTSLRRRDK